MLAVRLLVPLLTVVVALLGTYQFMGAIGPDVGAATADAGPGSTVARGTPDPIPGDHQRSLIRADRFARVLAAVREDYGAETKLSSLRLAPERVDLEVVRRDETEAIQYDSDAEVTFRDRRTLGLGDAILVTRIDPAIPERIMGRARRRFGTRLADLNYMVLSISTGSAAEWLAFGKEGGTPVRAPLSGKPVTR